MQSEETTPQQHPQLERNPPGLLRIFWFVGLSLWSHASYNPFWTLQTNWDLILQQTAYCNSRGRLSHYMLTMRVRSLYFSRSFCMGSQCVCACLLFFIYLFRVGFILYVCMFICLCVCVSLCLHIFMSIPFQHQSNTVQSIPFQSNPIQSNNANPTQPYRNLFPACRNY